MDFKPDYEAIIADQQVLIRTLWALLEQIADDLDPGEDKFIREIVDGTKRHAVYISVCACGHMMADHDTKGCMYLGCKRICGQTPE